MNGYSKDQRRAPYSNSRAFSPVVIWGMVVGLLTQTVVGTTYIVRMEGDVGRNEVEIEHVREMQAQTNDHTKEALKEQKEQLDDLDEKLDEIQRLLRESLKE